MITQLVLLTRSPNSTFDEFSSYWKKVHAPIAKKMPDVIRYVQYHGVANQSGEAAYDGVALIQFADMETLQRSWDSPAGKATAADIPNFLDGSKTVMVITEANQVI